jgi:hypothetical protein
LQINSFEELKEILKIKHQASFDNINEEIFTLDEGIIAIFDYFISGSFIFLFQKLKALLEVFRKL